jgi:serine phosphatase RsbU (regulator of sigma subunit)
LIARVGAKAAERIDTDGQPVGIGTAWTTMSVTLHRGDALVIISDGILDYWGGSLDEVSTQIGRAVAQQQGAQAIANALAKGAAREVDRDDLTVVVLERIADDSPTLVGADERLTAVGVTARGADLRRKP